MEESTSIEGEEGGGLCAPLSLCEDQVPAVGQQTEIGEETGDEGEEEDVVSSLTFCEPESGASGRVTGQSIISEHQEEVGESVSAVGQWYVYAHGTTNAQMRVARDVHTDVWPDSVQQEEAVTTSSKSSAVTVPLLARADSSEPVLTAGADGGNINDSSLDPVRQGAVLNLVNYDSSDSDDSSVKTPRIDDLKEEEGHQFQYPDSNTQSLETEDQKDMSQFSSIAASIEQSGACEQGLDVGEGSGNEGYWSNEGYWVDSQGQVWQPQGQDGYWHQGQQWSQQTEGQEGNWHGYEGNHGGDVQGYGNQGKQWHSQEGVEAREQNWPSEHMRGGVQGSEAGNQQQQWSGNNPLSSTNQQVQGQYSSHDYYQQQCAGQQYHSSTTDSGVQQYYDQTAYYGQDGYTSDSSQQQVQAGFSEGGVDASQNSSTQKAYPAANQQQLEPGQQQTPYPQPVDYCQYRDSEGPVYSHQSQTISNPDASRHYNTATVHRGDASQWNQSQVQQEQGHHSQEGQTGYSYHQIQGQPNQPHYSQEHQYNQQDSAQSYDTRAQQPQPFDHTPYAQQDQEQPYRQQGQYDQGAHSYSQQDPVQYNNQQTQPYSQQDQHNQQTPQSYGPQEQGQYSQQHERRTHSSYDRGGQQNFEQNGWNNHQQSAEYAEQGYGSQPHGHHPEYSSSGPQEPGGWNCRSQGSNGGSYMYYQHSEHAPQQGGRDGSQRQPQQYYDQQYGAQHTPTSGYHNQTPPVMPPSSVYPPIPHSAPCPPFSPPHALPSLPHPPPHAPPSLSPPPPHAAPSLPPPPPPNLPPPLPHHPPPHIPPPPPHPHIPPPSHLPSSVLPPTPSSQHYHSRNCSHSSSSQPSWQRRDTHYTDSHWKKWKCHRRDASLSHGPHHSLPTVPSSPAKSVLSDVSSTSRDSSTPVRVSSPVQCSPVAECSVQKSSKLAKTVFSQQLRDPRRSSPPSTSPRDKSNSKYTGPASSLVHKRSAPLKQKSETSASSAGPSEAEPHLVKTEKSGKDSKSKASGGEPLSFPKSSLSGFRIPKHNKSSEQSKSQSTLGDSQVITRKKTPIATQALHKSEVEATVVEGTLDEVEMKEGFTAQRELSTKSDGEDNPSAPAKELEIVGIEPVAEVEETLEAKSDKSVLEAKSDKSALEVKSDKSISTQPSGETSRQDLVSLFKSIDNNTLYALASTIQLALNTSSSQNVKSPVDSKIAAASTTATMESSECKTDVQQPATPADTAEMKEMSPVASKIPSSSASATAQESTKENVQQQATPDISPTNMTTKEKVLSTDQDLQPEPTSCPPSQIQVKTDPKAMGVHVGAPRMVIATVLSTSAGTSSLPDITETNHTQREEALTVCIPIRKEVKFQVKSYPKVEEKAEWKDVEEAPTTSQPVKQSDNIMMQDEPKNETSHESKSKAVNVKSPTLSLLTAQDLMFDPKYMYKEYNLRRVRKQESSPEPQKKQKVDKTQANESPVGASLVSADKETVEHPAEKDSPPQTAGKRKRGRPQLALKEPSVEPPESKKPREDTCSKRAEDAVAEQSTKNKSDDSGYCPVKRASVSIQPTQPNSSSLTSPPQITLTQLLSTPAVAQEHVHKQPPTSPMKIQDKHLVKDKDKVEKKRVKSPTKLPSRVSGVHRTSQLLCTLCKEKGGVSNLGFLFGPYYYQLDAECNDNSISSSGGVEVWLHEDCCVWAPGVCLVGRELQGLKEALTDANIMVCSLCKRLGATLCCASRGCKNIYHFPCAVEKGCVLNEEQFQIHCPKHKENVQGD